MDVYRSHTLQCKIKKKNQRKMCPDCLCSAIQVSIRHSNTIQLSRKLLCIGYFQRERKQAACVGEYARTIRTVQSMYNMHMAPVERQQWTFWLKSWC